VVKLVGFLKLIQYSFYAMNCAFAAWWSRQAIIYVCKRVERKCYVRTIWT